MKKKHQQHQSASGEEMIQTPNASRTRSFKLGAVGKRKENEKKNPRRVPVEGPRGIHRDRGGKNKGRREKGEKTFIRRSDTKLRNQKKRGGESKNEFHMVSRRQSSYSRLSHKEMTMVRRRIERTSGKWLTKKGPTKDGLSLGENKSHPGATAVLRFSSHNE